MTKLFGEGEVIVETHGLRPHRFGNRRGILFNMELSVYDGPDYGGLVGAFSADGKLYMVMFLAARPHYFDVLGARALAVIKSARL